MCRTTIPAVRVSCSYGARRRHRRPTDHDVPICVTTAGTTTSHCTCEAGRPPRCMAPPLCRAGRRSRRNNLQHTPSAAAVDRRDRQTDRQTGRETGRPTDGPPRCTVAQLCRAPQPPQQPATQAICCCRLTGQTDGQTNGRPRYTAAQFCRQGGKGKVREEKMGREGMGSTSKARGGDEKEEMGGKG